MLPRGGRAMPASGQRNILSHLTRTPGTVLMFVDWSAKIQHLIRNSPRFFPVFPAGRKDIAAGHCVAQHAFLRFHLASTGKPAGYALLSGSLPEIFIPSLNQPLDDGKNHRRGNAEQKHSIRRFQRSQQSPRWRHDQVPVTQGREIHGGDTCARTRARESPNPRNVVRSLSQGDSPLFFPACSPEMRSASPSVFNTPGLASSTANGS